MITIKKMFELIRKILLEYLLTSINIQMTVIDRNRLRTDAAYKTFPGVNNAKAQAIKNHNWCSRKTGRIKNSHFKQFLKPQR